MSRAPAPLPWPYRRLQAFSARAPTSRAGPSARAPSPRPTGRPAPQPTFQGQLPGERIIWRGRRSRLFLLATGWPLPAGFLALQALGLASPALGVFTLPLLGVGMLLLLLFALWWLPTRGWSWIFQRYTLTDQRAIMSVGSVRRRREEIELGNIVQVRVNQRNLAQMALGVGDVELRTAGASLLLSDVARPHAIADTIRTVMGAHPKQRAQAAPPVVPNKQVQAALEELARPATMPPAPVVRRSAPPGFGRRRIPVRLLNDEALVEVIYRHWFVLARRLLVAASVLVAGVVLDAALTAVGNDGWPSLVLIGGIGASAIVGLLTYVNWADDAFVLTTQRVIDIDRLFFILAETTNDAAYGNVQNVRVQQGLGGKLLGFGSILVETAGRQHPLEMKDIPHAFEVMDRIFALVRLASEREQVAAANKEKQERYVWLSTVLSRLLVTVPEVRGLPLLQAIAVAQGAGLHLVVVGERVAPGGLPGRVLEQMPSAGTCALNAAELRVMLSAGSRMGGPTGGGPTGRGG